MRCNQSSTIVMMHDCHLDFSSHDLGQPECLSDNEVQNVQHSLNQVSDCKCDGVAVRLMRERELSTVHKDLYHLNTVANTSVS